MIRIWQHQCKVTQSKPRASYPLTSLKFPPSAMSMVIGVELMIFIERLWIARAYPGRDLWQLGRTSVGYAACVCVPSIWRRLLTGTTTAWPSTGLWDGERPIAALSAGSLFYLGPRLKKTLEDS